jgi:hypothetical protein
MRGLVTGLEDSIGILLRSVDLLQLVEEGSMLITHREGEQVLSPLLHKEIAICSNLSVSV